MSDTPEKLHIIALKKALRTMYETGYDATCDAIEDTLSERDDLLTGILCLRDENSHLRAMNQRLIEALAEMAPLTPRIITVEKL